MATREETIQDLKKRLARMKHEIFRLEAGKACINAGNRYQVHHTKQATAETHLFALKTPDSAVEMLWGIYDGPEGILRWKRREGYGQPPRILNGSPGNQHAMCTPIIEVAADGKTARALWMMFAYYGECWAGGQFAMDFIQEDGVWKVWRYNTGGLLYAPFAVGWHKENMGVITRMNEGESKLPPEERTNRPPSYKWMWTPDAIFQNIPPVPLPYETWDDSLACIPVIGREWKLEKFE
jgi:hypothetical protein